ncbi:TlpA family protein disulfide reductase [Paludisphaera mucosa]|uniref:TlpA disulfide reductase family protein n=1 Tax=Paludisphaera mucosa TaxID=3030827 RepID=A0ABT6FM20_9BACT|nr:TlpA disulfide reductase family protein [Paludisphaera mucosa]MDG3008425.1 TlpA disulfide reductase family protein [Paludisphaera mucosa]
MTRVWDAGSWKTWIVLLAGLTSQAVSAAKAEEELPRYRLEPGMVLSYTGRTSIKANSDTFFEDQDTTAWVVRRNSDGSRRVVIRVGNRLREAAGPGAGKAPTKGQQLPPMEYSLGYFDLSPDGRLGADAQLGSDFDPAIAFPRLPDKPSAGEWGQRDARTGQEYGYSSLRRGTDGWGFHAERLGPLKRVYTIGFGSDYRFDRGMVVGAEQHFSQEIGVKTKGTGKLELAGVETKNAAWVAAFAPAADRSIAALRAYRKAIQAAAKDAENGASLLADARRKLQAARDATDEPVFREEFDRKLAGHDARAKAYMESAKRRAAVVGKPFPDWSLQGLDGETHSLADYRGRVVVLDFWFRGCGWCIKAMPEIDAVAEKFKGRPVAVLGMNTDAEEEDARFVAEVMGLKYPTLRARGVPEKIDVKGFPAVILVGPDGVVRDIHYGYSPTMGAELTKAIEGLLPRGAKSTRKP